MSRWIAALSVSLLFLGVSISFSQENTGPTKSSKKDANGYAEIAKAPEKAVSRRNPFYQDPDAIPAGRLLFERHCSECHGNNAEGGKKGPSLRAQEVQNAAPGAIFWILTNGVVRRGMPVWSKLPEPQRWQLVTYIKSLGTASAVQADSEPTKSQTSVTDPPSPPR
jgi:mono/diheme cytochrome c family protein